MKYSCWKFIFLYFISLSAVTLSNDQVEEVVMRNRKRISLHSHDPLTRRSAGEKHFIRFGRGGSSNSQQHFIPSRISNDDVRKNDSNEKKVLRKREIRYEPLTESEIVQEPFVDEGNTMVILSPNIICWISVKICISLLEGQLIIHFLKGENSSMQHFHLVKKYHSIGIRNDDRSKSDIGVRFNIHDVDNHHWTSKTENEDMQRHTNNYSRRNEVFSIEKSIGLNKNDIQLLLKWVKNSNKTMNYHEPFYFSQLESLKKILKNADIKHDFLAYGNDIFVRIGRSTLGRNLFSRYDRSRDNFMRLGRSTSKLNREEDGARFKRKYDSNFMRLGREANVSNYHRFSRKHGSFMRYGKSGFEVRDYDRLARKHENFMRLGRAYSCFKTFDRTNTNSTCMRDKWHKSKRNKPQNFIRLGRNNFGAYENGDTSNSITGNIEQKSRRLFRTLDNFLRIGRILDSKKVIVSLDSANNSRQRRSQHSHQKTENFVRFGRSMDGKSVTNEESNHISVKQNEHSLSNLGELNRKRYFILPWNRNSRIFSNLPISRAKNNQYVNVTFKKKNV